MAVAITVDYNVIRNLLHGNATLQQTQQIGHIMPLQVSWIESPLILGIDLVADINADEIDALGREGVASVRRQYVYFLIDFSEVGSLPKNLVNTALRSAALMELVNHENARYFVFVKPPASARQMIDMVFRTVSHRIMDDRDDAIAYLRDTVIPGE